jgi:hypothetical protein
MVKEVFSILNIKNFNALPFGMIIGQLILGKIIFKKKLLINTRK